MPSAQRTRHRPIRAVSGDMADRPERRPPTLIYSIAVLRTAVQPTCSHGGGWRCLWLPDRLRTVSWNQTLTARCRWLQAGVPHSNPGSPTKFLKDLQPGTVYDGSFCDADCDITSAARPHRVPSLAPPSDSSAVARWRRSWKRSLAPSSAMQVEIYAASTMGPERRIR